MKSLPHGYAPAGRLDLSRQFLLMIGLNVVGAAAFFVVLGLVAQLAAALRPELAGAGFSASGVEFLGVLAAALGLALLTVVAHEALHGVFFWYFTRERPVFGFKGLYAYAAAPGWYLPRWPYVTIGLAPLVGLTVLGVLLLLVLPASAAPALIFVIAANAAGSVGDLLVVAWVLSKHPQALACDSGDAITMYEPATPGG